MRRAHELAGVVVVSIFVNPMQFGASEDLDSYPRTLADDQEKLEAEDVHYLFVPSVEEMYPNGIDNHTTQRSSVTRQILGQRMNDYVGSILNWV